MHNIATQASILESPERSIFNFLLRRIQALSSAEAKFRARCVIYCYLHLHINGMKLYHWKLVQH